MVELVNRRTGAELLMDISGMVSSDISEVLNGYTWAVQMVGDELAMLS